MEFVGNGIDRKAVIELDGYVEARERIDALLWALRCWNDEIPPSNDILCSIADLIAALLPSEKDCDILDQYHRKGAHS